MSDPIGPGDWVEFIRQSPTRTTSGPPRLVVGQIYCVRETSTCLGSDGVVRPSIRLVGVFLGVNDRGCEGSARVDLFRPIHRPGKSTLIADLKAKVGEGVG